MIEPENEISDKSLADAFLVELSALSRKHGIGINGQGTLFLMERTDMQLSYTIDKDSSLSFA